jgi:hypothetical protein
LVAKGIESISKSEFKKVVLSRKETIPVPNFDLIATFQNYSNCILVLLSIVLSSKNGIG